MLRFPSRNSPFDAFWSPLGLALLLVGLSAGGDVSAAEITHGPILGRPGSGSMGLWARTSEPGAFTVHYGLRRNPLDQRSAPVPTRAESDNTGHILLEGLRPGTLYHYQVVADGKGAGPGGTFRTLPDPDPLRDAAFNPRGLFNFRFEFACGNNQAPEHGLGPTLPTYNTLLRSVRDQVAFSILNGDWLYEEQREYPATEWLRQAGLGKGPLPRRVEIAPTLAGVWENYKTYLRRAPHLAEWHRHVPGLFTFDDHEILNDVWGTGTEGLRNRRTVFRDIGVQAWYDYLGWSNPTVTHQPIHFGQARLQAGSDVLTDPEADFTAIHWEETSNLHVHWGEPDAGVNDMALDERGGHPSAGTYGVVEVLDRHRLRLRPAPPADGVVSYSIGRLNHARLRVANCEFLLLDTRGNRDLHDVNNPAKPGISMIGKTQREWLLRTMRESDADFFFVVSSVNFMIPHVGGGGVAFHANKDEAWTVFLEERERLINFWDQLGKPVFVLTGDLHNSFAIRITDNVWEFASGPHNSVNHTPNDEGGRPANGPFQHGPRACDIRWSTYVHPDIPRPERMYPVYTVVQVNNVFNNPLKQGDTRLIAYPHPQVIFQFHDGRTGDLLYAEAISTER